MHRSSSFHTNKFGHIRRENVHQHKIPQRVLPGTSSLYWRVCSDGYGCIQTLKFYRECCIFIIQLPCKFQESKLSSSENSLPKAFSFFQTSLVNTELALHWLNNTYSKADTCATFNVYSISWLCINRVLREALGFEEDISSMMSSPVLEKLLWWLNYNNILVRWGSYDLLLWDMTFLFVQMAARRW